MIDRFIVTNKHISTMIRNLWDFKIQMNNPILARRPAVVIKNNEKNESDNGLCYPSRPQTKIE